MVILKRKITRSDTFTRDASCIENAEIDMHTIVKYLGARINEEALQKDLLLDDHQHSTDDFTGVIISVTMLHKHY